MRNIKLTLKFDGTNYHGWQKQENVITVQECVENAIHSVMGDKTVHLIGCGRTDAGVHAKNYIASFKTNSSIPSDRIPFALNTALPPDIVCTMAVEVSDSFEPGRCALMKRYTYTINCDYVQDPFMRHFSYFVKYNLDVESMIKAAEKFVGTHDFVGFASSGFSVKTTVRTIYSIKIIKKNNLIFIEVAGNGFLYNMVRIIAGTLIFVGMGKINCEDIPYVLKSHDRKLGGITAPPQGLCLSEVFY